MQVSPATVAAWRERFSEDGLQNFSAVRPGRGPKPSIPAEKVEEIVRLTLHETAARGDALELPVDGQAGRGVALDGAADLVRARDPAASGRDLQAVERPEVRGKARRRRRPVHEPAGEGHRAVHGREEPDPSVGSHPAVAADQARPGGNDDPRLQAQRDDHPVRRSRRAHRQGDRPVPATPPPHRVPHVPEDDRPRGPQTAERPSRSSTTTRPTTTPRSRPGWHAIPASSCTSRRPPAAG